MSQTQRTAAEAALYALERWTTAAPEEYDDCVARAMLAITRLRAALDEQPREPEMRRCPRCWEPMLMPVSAGQEVEQEPVAWALMQDGECIEVNTLKWITDAGLLEFDGEVVPLYAHPPRREWHSLTGEELDAAVAQNITITDPRLTDAVYGVALTVEATLKEKNG